MIYRNKEQVASLYFAMILWPGFALCVTIPNPYANHFRFCLVWAKSEGMMVFLSFWATSSIWGRVHSCCTEIKKGSDWTRRHCPPWLWVCSSSNNADAKPAKDRSTDLSFVYLFIYCFHLFIFPKWGPFHMNTSAKELEEIPEKLQTVYSAVTVSNMVLSWL